ncbi:MAG: hypothetical protein U1F33_01420 [Alphaproteobacteria bacterium]|mgnify:CR=1 FL=1
MALSKRCVETMLDLVEIKLSTIQVMDREDAREAAILEACKRELAGLLHKPRAQTRAVNGAMAGAMTDASAARPAAI